jgi:DNA-binding MarR family transcriptional regulator
MPDRPRSLGRLLNFAAGGCNQMCNAMLAPHGLTLPQWVILSALWREDGMHVAELARWNGTNLPAVSRLLDRMAAAGLVVRRADPQDRRAVRVFLTDRAVGMRDLMDFYRNVNDRLLAGFSDAEAARLFDMLARVADNARADPGDQ